MAVVFAVVPSPKFHLNPLYVPEPPVGVATNVTSRGAFPDSGVPAIVTAKEPEPPIVILIVSVPLFLALSVTVTTTV